VGLSVRWDSIAKIHNIAVVRRLSIWLLLLPLLARAAQSQPVAQLGPNITLPFTWGLLYSAALIFLLSTILHGLRCPRVIKDYEGWYDYRHREGSYEKLIPLLAQVLRTLSRDSRFEYLQRRFELGNIRPLDKAGGEIPKNRWREVSDDLKTLEGALRRSDAPEHAIVDIYASAREVAQQIRPISRWLITVLQMTALLFVFALLVENSMSVVQQYFPESAASVWWRNWRWR
jgi:hypothetical protein